MARKDRHPHVKRVSARRGVGLTLKVAGLLTLALGGVLLTYAYLNVRRERAFFEEMKELHGRIVSQGMAKRLAAQWSEDDAQAGGVLHEELDQLGEHLTVDWVSIDSDPTTEDEAALTAAQLRSLQGGQIVNLVRREAGRELMHTYAPVPPPGHGAVVVEQSFTDRDFYVQASLFRFFVMLGLVIVINPGWRY